MKAKQLESMSVPDMEKKLAELQQEYLKLNTQIASHAQLKSPSLVRNTKKSIARLLQQMESKKAAEAKTKKATNAASTKSTPKKEE